MADSLVKYKRYRMEELQEAFFREPVFYSRSASFRARCPGLPDLVLVTFNREQSDWGCVYRLTIKAELQNQTDYVTEVLKMQGYTYHIAGGSSAWVKSTSVSARSSDRPLQLLRKIVSSLDNLLSRLPFCMYESQSSKRLRDYVNFMTSSQAKLRYADVVKCFGGREDALVKVAQEISQSRYVRRSFFYPTEKEYRIAHLPDNEWCAWVSGDDYIPVFPNEQIAVRFLENRNALYASQN